MLTCCIDLLSAIHLYEYKYVLALAALNDAWSQLDDDVDGNHQRGHTL